jgi:enterochelin esterase-like enzyme
VLERAVVSYNIAPKRRGHLQEARRPFLTDTTRLADELRRAGVQTELQVRVGGHDEAIWCDEFARALVEAFGAG